MRETLFKAKSVKNGKWVESGSIIRDGDNKFCAIIPSGSNLEVSSVIKYIKVTPVRVDPSTVCQFTGLLDSNGVKIFEGDSMVNIHKKYTVKFNDGAFWMVDESTGADNWENIRDCTITGNIHDKDQS